MLTIIGLRSEQETPPLFSITSTLNNVNRYQNQVNMYHFDIIFIQLTGFLRRKVFFFPEMFHSYHHLKVKPPNPNVKILP